MKKSTKIILLVLILLLAAGLGAGLFLMQREAESEVIENAGSSDNAVKPVTSITRGETEYPLKKRTDTVLILGTDRTENKPTNSEIESYYNFDLADFIVLLVFDHDAKTVAPFQVNRDTVCSVPWLAVNGIVGGHRTEQICFAHTYGSGKNDSCENTRNAVSGLLYNVPVDNYMAFTMDAVPIINDLVGGVTVTLEDDIPALGEDYVKGAKIRLNGKDALRFVRTRDTMYLDSNLTRQQHQRIYLTAFTAAAREAVKSNEDLAVDTFRAIDKFMCTDLTVNDISEIVDWLCEYEVLPVISPDGEVTQGEKFAEFIVDEASLWSCVESTFVKS